MNCIVLNQCHTVLKHVARAGIIALFVSTSLSAFSEDRLTIGGTYLGLVNYLYENSAASTQFDFAANLDVEYVISPQLSGIVQLQTGAGDGRFGLGGPGVVVTDLNLEYRTLYDLFTFTFGSFDTPFGEETAFLTNNADSFQNPFFLNPLVYSAFAGPTGTLNTLGVMGEFLLPFVDLTVALTNGTGETAVNSSSDLEYVLRLGTGFFQKMYFSVSYMDSNDMGDQAVTANTSFAADFTGVIADVILNPAENATLKGYVGRLTYGDRNPATQDAVDFWKVEAKWDMAPFYIAARYSHWQPQDRNGNGSGISPFLPYPGMSILAMQPTDTLVTRTQVAVGNFLQEDLLFKLEIFWDHVPQGIDVSGIIALLNGRF